MSRNQNIKTGPRYVIINAAQENRRIDNFLLGELKGLPKTRIYQMLRRGEIRVNGGRKKQLYRLNRGDRVRIPPVAGPESAKSAEPRDYLRNMVAGSIIFEDEDLVVVNKPAGIVVHGGSGRSFGIIEILRYLRPSETDLQLVHRLDRETSGCLLISKHGNSLQRLHAALRAGEIEKQYTALIKGRLDSPVIDVSQPLRKNAIQAGERMVTVSEQGKQALTRFEIIKEFKAATLVRVYLFTGRTHQIRVHAAHIQQPVAGDGKYGDKEFNRSLRQSGLRRLFLHASRLRIAAGNGFTGLEIKAPLAADLNGFLEGYV